MESRIGMRRSSQSGLLPRALGAGMLASALLTAPCTAATFQLRSPQVMINGGGIQGYLNAIGENIDVQRDQIVGALIRASVISNNSAVTIQFELSGTAGGNAIGLYDGHDANPVLMPVFPTSAVAGWFAVASYRLSPTRVTVNVFDETAALRSTQTFLGGDRNAIGFFLSGPGGLLYSQDHRNPNGAPQCLFFPGTGINSGSMWLAFEAEPFVGGDHDFDDAIVFVEAPFTSLTPNLHTTWGQLKQRFR